MNTRLELTPQERYDIVSYRIENAQKTLGEIENLVALKYFNTAANRMYYACYYAVCALLIANKFNTKSHDGAKQMFSLHFIKTGILPMHLSIIYSTLFKQRLSGDYDDMFDNTLETVNELYPKAQEFIAAVKEKVDIWLSENRGQYEASQKEYWDYTSTLETAEMKGEKKGKTEIARKMKDKGFSANDIAEITGLSTLEITEL